MIDTSAIMRIPGTLRSRVYLPLGIVYLIFASMLCLRAPVVQRPIEVTADEIESEPDRSKDPYYAIEVPIDSKGTDSANKRAPLWALGSQFSLNYQLFAAEQGELLGLALFAALLYRFKARLVTWSIAISTFLASRRRGTCIWLGFAMALALSFFPPWIETTTSPGRFPAQRWKLWHAPLWHEPAPPNRWATIEVDYCRMLTEISVGECFVIALFLTWGRTREKGGVLKPQIANTGPPERSEDAATIAALRQNLRLKVLYNEEAIDRLIEFERSRTPGASFQTLMEAAIERWERDNR